MDHETRANQGTPEHTAVVASVLAGLSVGSQNRGVLGEITFDGVPGREVAERVARDPAAAPEHRRRCLRAVQRLGNPASQSFYEEILGGEDEELVQQVLRDRVIDQPSVSWIDPLRRLLDAPHAVHIAAALACLGAEEATADLIALGAREPESLDTVLIALRRIHRVDLGRDLESYRVHAEKVARTPQLERLRADLDHAEERVRSAALEDSSTRGDPACIPAILAMARQGKKERHHAARLAVRLLPFLDELRSDHRCAPGGRPNPGATLEVLIERFM